MWSGMPSRLHPSLVQLGDSVLLLTELVSVFAFNAVMSLQHLLYGRVQSMVNI